MDWHLPQHFRVRFVELADAHERANVAQNPVQLSRCMNGNVGRSGPAGEIQNERLDGERDVEAPLESRVGLLDALKCQRRRCGGQAGSVESTITHVRDQCVDGSRMDFSSCFELHERRG